MCLSNDMKTKATSDVSVCNTMYGGGEYFFSKLLL